MNDFSNQIRAIYGTELPPSELAEAMKQCTIIRQRKLYPMYEMTTWNEQVIYDDMFAWVIRLEDKAIVEAIARAMNDGVISAGIALNAADIEDTLRKQIPMRSLGYCPRCHENLYYGLDIKYCGHCGQAIVWKENTSVKTRDTKYEEE